MPANQCCILRRLFILLACLYFPSLLCAANATDLRQALEAVAAQENTTDWSADARHELDALINAAVAQASVNGNVPTAAQIAEAENNFRQLLKSLHTSHGIENHIPRQLEQVRSGRYYLCPLWPFC